jgi:hypothetical protein
VRDYFSLQLLTDAQLAVVWRVRAFSSSSGSALPFFFGSKLACIGQQVNRFP